MNRTEAWGLGDSQMLLEDTCGPSGIAKDNTERHLRVHVQRSALVDVAIAHQACTERCLRCRVEIEYALRGETGIAIGRAGSGESDEGIGVGLRFETTQDFRESRRPRNGEGEAAVRRGRTADDAVEEIAKPAKSPASDFVGAHVDGHRDDEMTVREIFEEGRPGHAAHGGTTQTFRNRCLTGTCGSANDDRLGGSDRYLSGRIGMARIAVGGFQHETNTFAPQQATWEEFVRADAWPPLLRGSEMIAGVEGFNIPIAGAVKKLAELGHEIVPLAWAAAAPASYVTEDAYEKMWALFEEDLEKHGPFDAIYLDLHGAMVAEHTEDGEGELLRRIRANVGDELPIVASLDYHANLTPEMAKLATALVGYRTYPHIDMAVTGSRAIELLDKLLREKRPVYRAYRQLDFLIPLVWQCTFIEPAKGIFDLVGEL
ncbi:MAG: M81 family peptidase, partial [Reyranella sp.]